LPVVYFSSAVGHHYAVPGQWQSGNTWREISTAIDDTCHNLLITKQLDATITIALIHAELMVATVREIPLMVGRKELEASVNKINSN
jgi:hypothetical protein